MSRPKSNTKAKSKSKTSKSKLKRFSHRILKYSGKVLIAGIAFLAVFLSLVYAGLFGKIPSIKELDQITSNTASEVYASDGTMIGKYYIENRRHIENQNISEHVINALIATEDSRFFEHKGLDYISMGRVLVHSILMGDRAQGGGSTISQQLAKSLYPRRDYHFLSLPVNKAREMFTAARLEEIYSKAEILNLYLNTVPFGENIYGIEVAANRFFSKSSARLAPHEAASLIGMLAANTYYNPRRNPDRNIARRNVVLERMVEQGFLSDEEGERYKKNDLDLNYRVLDHNNGPAPYFMQYIRKQVKKVIKEQFADTINLFADGLRIVTTLDSRLQDFASHAVNNHLLILQKEFENHWGNRKPWERRPEIYVSAIKNSKRYKSLAEKGWSETKIMEAMETPMPRVIIEDGEKKKVEMSAVDSVAWSLKQLQAGFMALNPADGHILAWVGGTNHEFFPYDHVLSSRQVGSTFKPFVYATALEEGYEPCDYISNERRTYRQFEDWSPANHNGKHDGFYSLQGALINSVNSITAELTIEAGPHDVIDLAQRAGISSDIEDVPSIGLGTTSLSLYEMVKAYTSFANFGRGITPVGLLRIEDANGEVLYDAEPASMSEPAFGEETARYMIHMLQGVVERGTASSLNKVYGLKTQIAGKTGTTQNNVDGWFIGFSPGIVAGAWVGADNPGIRFRTTQLGQGAHTALPVFARFMQQVEKSGSVSDIGRRTFYPLPEDLRARVDCPDFSEEDPDLNFFQRLFGGGKKDKEPKKEEVREEKSNDKEDEKDEDKGKSLLKKMRDIFRKKE